jgi:hypothetical protein
VRMEADKHLYPLLLSNGNKVAEGDLPEGKHFAMWEGFLCHLPNVEIDHLYFMHAFMCRSISEALISVRGGGWGSRFNS